MNTEPLPPEVLVVDDDVQIRRLLRLTLEGAGYTVREADTGRGGLAELAGRMPNAVILELALPDLPGLEVLRQLREWSPVPVLILSAFSQESSKIAGLDAGADDYLTKPFGGGELLARLRAMLRRNRPAEETSLHRFGPIEVDLARRRVTRAGQVVKLTVKEYALLQLLVSHRDRVVTHRQILRSLWGAKAEMQTHYLRVFMMRLRQKLEEEPDAPRYLQTETGVGYRLVSETV
jgi:two-component system KDP operon response regulator KdpE